MDLSDEEEDPNDEQIEVREQKKKDIEGVKDYF